MQLLSLIFYLKYFQHISERCYYIRLNFTANWTLRPNEKCETRKMNLLLRVLKACNKVYPLRENGTTEIKVSIKEYFNVTDSKMNHAHLAYIRVIRWISKEMAFFLVWNPNVTRLTFTHDKTKISVMS